MATTITSATHQDSLSGSPEKRIDLSPSGTLWALIIQNNRARFFSSSNGGSTWADSGSDLLLGSGQNTAVPSFFIDADGYAHVSFVRWQASPQVVIYARGTPRTGGGWSWSEKVISPASGRTGVDSDVIAFRNGTGWTVFVSYDLGGNASGARVAKLSVSATGTITVDATDHGPSSGGGTWQFGSLEFSHTGDGKTPTASPHLYFVTAHQAASNTLRGQKATYSGGIWTWQTPVTIAASQQVPDTALCSVHDGSDRIMVAWATGSTTITVSEWNVSTDVVTARNPPAMPGGTGNIKGLSLAHDPSTDDIYLLAYGATNGNIVYCKFTRGSTSWGSWTTVATRSASSNDGDVNAVRHPPRDSVDALYSEGSGPFTIKSTQVVALVRSPSAPTLTYPPNGARIDLAAGATFTWTYNPVSPGDTQQAYVLRRQYGGGPTTEYWNAAGNTWSGTEVWNASTLGKAEFAAGKWTNGTTYTWTVKTRSSTGADSAYASDRTVVASTAPVVTVTAPSGLSAGESTPLVTWTYTSTVAQASFQVRIVPTFGNVIDPNDPLPATWDSGVVGSSLARSVRVGTALTNNTAYRAYVKCTDANSVASQWAYSDFTISIQPPLGPLVETIDDLNEDTGVLRVRMDVVAQSNYLSADQALGQSGWSADCTIVAQPDDSANQLLPGIKLTSIAAGTLKAWTDPGSPPEAPYGEAPLTRPYPFPVIEGYVYTAVASFKSATTTRAARLLIDWYDDDDGTGVVMDTENGEQVNSVTGAYTTAHVTGTAPVGAKLAKVALEVLGATAAGEIFYVSQLSLHPGRSTSWQPGGYSGTQTLRIERSLDGGTTWSTFIDRVKPDYYQRVVELDRTAPFGTEVLYRGYTDVDPGGGALLSSAASLESAITLESRTWAIRDPNDTNGEFAALVTGYQRKDAETVAITRTAGRTYPIVDSEGLQSGEGTMEIYVPRSQRDTALDILTREVTLVVQSPDAMVAYVRLPEREYTAVDIQARSVTVQYVELETV